MSNGSAPVALTLNAIEKALVSRFKTAGKWYYFWLLVTWLVFLCGAVAGLRAMIEGHEYFYNTTREIPWGILISAYVFFVVTSTGLCLVSSIGHVFGFKDFMPIAKRSVFLSIATILSGFFVIAFEIKLPWRMAIYNVISPNLLSNIWWMGTLYGIYLVFMLAEFLFLNINKHKPAVYCGFFGSIAGITAHSNLGAVFGLLMGREFWHGPFMPVYFITSAMMTGCAVIIFFHYLAYKINKEDMDAAMKRNLQVTSNLGLLLVLIITFFTVWKTLGGIAGQPPGKYESIMALLNGPYAINFWGFEIGLGMVIPMTLYYFSKGKNLFWMFIGSASMILGIFMMRYDLVVVGQIVPVFHELGVNEYKHLLPYFPSLYEIIITVSGFALTGFLFLLGEKVFDGFKVEPHVVHLPDDEATELEMIFNVKPE